MFASSGFVTRAMVASRIVALLQRLMFEIVACESRLEGIDMLEFRFEL